MPFCELHSTYTWSCAVVRSTKFIIISLSLYRYCSYFSEIMSLHFDDSGSILYSFLTVRVCLFLHCADGVDNFCSGVMTVVLNFFVTLDKKKDFFQKCWQILSTTRANSYSLVWALDKPTSPFLENIRELGLGSRLAAFIIYENLKSKLV